MYLNQIELDRAVQKIEEYLFNLKQIIKPKKNPAKIPFTRAESMQIKIGIWAIAIAIIVPIVILFIEKKCF